MENLVEVINLSKSYGKKEAVKDINFKIKENEIIGLLGPNGCGKTTTIGMLLGLLKPSNGQININGMKIENYHSHFHIDLTSHGMFRVQFLPLNPLHLLRHLKESFQLNWFHTNSMSQSSLKMSMKTLTIDHESSAQLFQRNVGSMR